jgi:hypothetical protein
MNNMFSNISCSCSCLRWENKVNQQNYSFRETSYRREQQFIQKHFYFSAGKSKTRIQWFCTPYMDWEWDKRQIRYIDWSGGIHVKGEGCINCWTQNIKNIPHKLTEQSVLNIEMTNGLAGWLLNSLWEFELTSGRTSSNWRLIKIKRM